MQQRVKFRGFNTDTIPQQFYVGLEVDGKVCASYEYTQSARNNVTHKLRVPHGKYLVFVAESLVKAGLSRYFVHEFLPVGWEPNFEPG